MIEVYRAMQVLADSTGPLDLVDVPVADAVGRVLAETLRADRDYPPTDRSAMDGYAVRSADLAGGGGTLRLTGELQAGAPAEGVTVGPGEAVRLFTGSVVPAGADSVVMVERTREDAAAGTVVVEGPVPRGEHIRVRGGEMREGAVVLEGGAPIDPPEVAALAAIGRARVRVHRLPSVAVLSTGDELVEVGDAPREHQVRNSNGPALRAQLAELGIEGRDLGTAPDDRKQLEVLLHEGLTSDVFVLTGGVSVGKYDLVRESLEAAGMTVLFHKVAVKPGKPVLAGRCRNCLVIGLPGNPVSAYTGFTIFVAPALRRLMGMRRWANQPVTAVLQEPIRQQTGRVTYHLARLEYANDGYQGRAIGSRGSGDLLSMTRANGFLVAPADVTDVEAGTRLPALLFPRYQHR